jgi:hypothetical protein
MFGTREMEIHIKTVENWQGRAFILLKTTLLTYSMPGLWAFTNNSTVSGGNKI